MLTLLSGSNKIAKKDEHQLAPAMKTVDFSINRFILTVSILKIDFLTSCAVVSCPIFDCKLRASSRARSVEISPLNPVESWQISRDSKTSSLCDQVFRVEIWQN